MKKILAGLCCISLVLVLSTEGLSATKKRRAKRYRKSTVVTPAPVPAPVTPAPAPEVKTGWWDKFETTYKKGLYFKSKDEKYSLKFRIRLQARYTFETQNAVNRDNINTFQIRRAKLSWNGNVFSKNLAYALQINVAETSANKILEDAYIDYRFLDPLRIQAGQYKIPFNFQEIISSGRQQFVDRSLASGEFRFTTTTPTTNVTCTLPGGATVSGPGLTCGGGATATSTTTFPQEKFQRDIGLMLHGDAWDKKFEYYASVTNGSGLNKLNGNKSFLYSGRLVWNPLGQYGYSEADTEHSEHPAVTVGANAGFNREDNTGINFLMAGGNVGVKYKGFSFQGEYYLRDNGISSPGATKDHGYYAQAGYFVIPKHFEIAARASQIFKAGANNDKSEFMGGLNYYVFGHDLKVQTDYSFLRSDVNPTNFGGATNRNDHRFRVQLQTWF